MKLSVIFELLLIFLLIAFAAYGRVIKEKKSNRLPGIVHRDNPLDSFNQTAQNMGKYCNCAENTCNCCRDFPGAFAAFGPGCISLKYLPTDQLQWRLSTRNKVWSEKIFSDKKREPVCYTLIGGFTKICGKFHSIKKEDNKHASACLALELRSGSEIDATLSAGCFRYGPDGLQLRPPKAAPAENTAPEDDYDDFFGFGDDEDEDEDDSDDDDDEDKIPPEGDSESALADSDAEDSDQEIDEEEEDDLLGFGALLDILTGGATETTPNKKKPTTIKATYTTPVIFQTSTSPSIDTQANAIKNSALAGLTQSEIASDAVLPSLNFDKYSETTASPAGPIKDENPIITAENLSQVTNQLIQPINTHKVTKDKNPSNANNLNVPQKLQESAGSLVNKIQANAGNKPQSVQNVSEIESSDENSGANLEEDEEEEEEDEEEESEETKDIAPNKAANDDEYDDDDDDDEEDDDDSSEEENAALSTIVGDDSEDEAHNKLSKRKHKKD